MAWSDNYRQAKFRNIEFYVPDVENSGGRRGAIHEFPKKDDPYIEDMGRRARRFTIEAYIVGEDYFSQRDSLIEALEKEGKGKLVHPYLGTLDVFCLNYSFRESVRETRMVRFTLSFIEAGSLSFPTYTVDTINNITTKKATALQVVKDALERAFTIASVPYSISQNALATIDNGLSLIADSKRVVSAVASFKRDIENIRGRIPQLAYDVQDLAQEMVDILTFGTNITDSFEATVDNVKNQFKEMRDMWDFVPEEIITEDDPSMTYAYFIQENAVINAMGLMSIMEYDSLDEAISYRDQVFNKLEELLLLIEDDDLYTALYNLQTAVSQDIEIRGSQLARLIDHRLNTTLPAIVVSHDLYGNIDQEQDIIDRNRILHPSFIPGGQDIEVLIYA